MEQRLQVKLQLPQEHSPRELGRWIAVVEGLEVEPGGRLELVVALAGIVPELLKGDVEREVVVEVVGRTRWMPAMRRRRLLK